VVSDLEYTKTFNTAIQRTEENVGNCNKKTLKIHYKHLKLEFKQIEKVGTVINLVGS